VFTALYGVSTSLIALDTGLKLVRVTLTVSRVLSEASITKMTQALSSPEPSSAKRLTKMLLAAGAAFAVPFALLVMLDDRMIFSFLLGPNFVIPGGLGRPIAIAILGSIFFQISIYFIGHFGDSSEMRDTFIVSLVMSAAFAISVLIARPSLPTAMWIFVSTFVVVGMVATLVFLRTIGSSRLTAVNPT
jgi:O-antigen/teichoic acid export membrane protein